MTPWSYVSIRSSEKLTFLINFQWHFSEYIFLRNKDFICDL